jgi:hypothetical protein
VLIWGCASTEFYNEGPGQPSERASGAVPPGSIGVCRKPHAKRPPIVNATLWEDAHECTSRTPERYIRLGYGRDDDKTQAAEEEDKDQIHYLEILKEGSNVETGNSKLTSTLKILHEAGLKDPALRERVARSTERSYSCDYTYLFNTMAKTRAKLEANETCPISVYDPKLRTETCLVDVQRAEVGWFTSSWSCVSHTNAAGEAQSCYRLCGYDDYCAKQVSCTAPDVDLMLCAMGVCQPVAKAGI